MRPICVKCEVELKATATGALLVETQRTKSGDDFENRPYRVWSVDISACPKCEHEVVIGFGRSPVIEMFEPQAVSRLEEMKAKAKRVIYCHER